MAKSLCKISWMLSGYERKNAVIGLSDVSQIRRLEYSVQTNIQSEPLTLTHPTLNYL